MITINLLPVELRREEKTPMPIFILLCIGIAFAGGLFVWFLLLTKEIAGREEFLKNKKDDLESKKSQAVEYDELKNKKLQFEKREQTIKDIRGGRILVSKKLAQLFKLTPQDDTWFTAISGNTCSGKGGAKGMIYKNRESRGFLSLKCHRLGKDVSKADEFAIKLIKDRNFFKDFNNYNDPDVTTAVDSKHSGKSYYIDFGLNFAFKPMMTKKRGKK